MNWPGLDKSDRLPGAPGLLKNKASTGFSDNNTRESRKSGSFSGNWMARNPQILSTYGRVKFLQRHLFPVVARFERVVAVSFAFPEEVLKPLVPEGLEIDSFDGLGFVTVALVWTRNLRPAGFPKVLGRDFFLSGYRIFTRLEDHDGRRLRGLQIIRSETDKVGMVVLGNLMTGYHYRKVLVAEECDGVESRVVTSLASAETTLDVRFRSVNGTAELPLGSPFKNGREARRFAGPMPFTFSSQGAGSFVVVQGTRQSWKPSPLVVDDWEVGLFREAPFNGVAPVLANAFEVRDVDYRWERGRVVKRGEVE